MGMPFENRPIQVERSVIEQARRMATQIRQRAEAEYAQMQIDASRYELLASLLEQGYSLEESRRRAFHPRIDQ